MLKPASLLAACCTAIIASTIVFGGLTESNGGDGGKRATPAQNLPKDPLPAGAFMRLGSAQLRENNLGALSVSFLSDGRTLVTTGPDKKVVFWSLQTAQPIRTLAGHLHVALSPDGKLLASTGDYNDKIIRLFDVATEREIGQIPATNRSIGFRFSPDSRYLAVGGGQVVPGTDVLPMRLWEVPACKIAREFPQRSTLGSLVFSHDGKKLVSGHSWGVPRVQLWDLTKGIELRHFDEKVGMFSPNHNGIAISPDGEFLAGVGNSILLWEAHTGKARWQIYHGDPKIGNLGTEGTTALAFSPNSKIVAVGARRGTVSTIYLLEAATGRERARFETADKYVFSVAFSPCGTMLASAGQDCTYLIWDVTGKILAAKNPPAPLSAKQLDACWADLGGEQPVKLGWVDMRIKDTAKTWQAICALATRPEQAVPYLKKRLPSVPKLEPKRLAEFQDKLENGEIAARDRACKELADIGPPAIPFLQKLHGSGINADGKQRIEKLLGQPRKDGLLTDELRCVAAIEILEYIGTSEAKDLLRLQAQGEPGSPLAQEAKLALDRLAKLPKSK